MNNGCDYTALDIETPNFFRRSICSIGLTKFRNGEVVDEFYSLVNPRDLFTHKAIEIHGIREQDVLLAPIFSTVIQDVMDFIGDDLVVAHNASFDMGVIAKCYDNVGQLCPDVPYICSMQVARAYHGSTVKSNSLNNLAALYDVDLNHHNASSDAKVCGLILAKIVNQSPYDNLQELLKQLHFNEYGLLGQKSFTKTS